ncbi:hypothetical protein INT47_007069, partial [Mucor saturninus]
MTDNKSYKMNALFMMASKFYSDLYMKRNYKYLTRFISPSNVIITGDLMDNGREWKDDEFYKQEVNRFHRIFNTEHTKYYMAGNHDIGFGNGVNLNVRQRFESCFGNTSYVMETDLGYSFIMIDTVSLSSEDPEIRDSAIAILESDLPGTKRILMTHVPLYRDSTVSCGPNRQKKNTIIKNEYGYQYQNLVSWELSNYILEKVKPVAIFSGDDHDYCKVTHAPNITEITIPTFSMAQGVKRPGVVLLDLSSRDTLSSELCWLPDQVFMFLGYGYLLAFTIVILLLHHSLQWRKKKHFYLSKEEMGLTTMVTSTRTSFFNLVKDIVL